MPTTSDFLQYSQWSGIATLIIAVITVVSFIFQWGFRFRLVGSTSFMVVLTVGLFTLSLVPLSRTVIPGAVRYSLIYDNGSTQAVITTTPQISPSQLEATLRQAASDLYSYGRLGTTRDKDLTIRVRTLLHPEPGISVPLFLGQVKRSLVTREDPQMAIEIYYDKFAQLPKPTPEKVGS
jgi:hypothetical protein